MSAIGNALCKMGIHKWVKGKCERCGKKKTIGGKL